MWAWNRAQQSRVRGVEMSYLRVACGVARWDDEAMKASMRGVVWELMQI